MGAEESYETPMLACRTTPNHTSQGSALLENFHCRVVLALFTTVTMDLYKDKGTNCTLAASRTATGLACT